MLYVIDSMGFNAELARQQTQQQAQQHEQHGNACTQEQGPGQAAWEAARQRMLAVVQVGMPGGMSAQRVGASWCGVWPRAGRTEPQKAVVPATAGRP